MPESSSTSLPRLKCATIPAGSEALAQLSVADDHEPEPRVGPGELPGDPEEPVDALDRDESRNQRYDWRIRPNPPFRSLRGPLGLPLWPVQEEWLELQPGSH